MIREIVAIGNGAIGGSIAFELASRGFKVCRGGEADRTNAASKAAGAMNGCFDEITGGLLASEHGRLKLALLISDENAVNSHLSSSSGINCLPAWDYWIICAGLIRRRFLPTG